MEPADVVLRFLESVGRRSEAEFYVSLFRAEPKEQFAAISVDSNVARYATEAVVLHLRFLHALGLVPVVVLGLFEPIDAFEHAARIRRRLEKAGVQGELVPATDPIGLHAGCIETMRKGVIPVVAFGAAEGATVEERVARLAALLTDLKTRKLLFLHRPGGLRQKGALVPIVNLQSDYAGLVASKELSRKERAILVQSRRLVTELVPHKLVVSVTSPLNLMRELFTVKGAGTLLRRGSTIVRHESLADIDRDRLRQLLTSAFGRAPFEEFFDKPVLRVYLEEGYRGAAVLNPTPLGPYLSKFAVGREAQGEGLGRDLWDAFVTDLPSVFWRARRTNPIGDWYAKQADGLMKSGDWVVYWKNIAPERLADAIAYALAQPLDLPAPAIDAA